MWSGLQSVRDQPNPDANEGILGVSIQTIDVPDKLQCPLSLSQSALVISSPGAYTATVEP